jgi:hypothetical protein
MRNKPEVEPDPVPDPVLELDPVAEPDPDAEPDPLPDSDLNNFSVKFFPEIFLVEICSFFAP